MSDFKDALLFAAAISGALSLGLIAHNVEKAVRILQQIANRMDN